MQTLYGGELNHAICVVIENLIAQKKFDLAQSLCDKCLNLFPNDNIKANMRALRTRINNAKIGNVVMQLINQTIPKSEEDSYFELIQREILLGNINPSSISLGKNCIGSRDIKLVDIWPGTLKKETLR